MARRHREEEDDGRVIADMSDLSHPSPMGHLFERTPRSSGEPEQRPRYESDPLTRRERWSIIWMSLKAALLIAAVFIVGIGLFIALILLIWNLI